MEMHPHIHSQLYSDKSVNVIRMKNNFINDSEITGISYQKRTKNKQKPCMIYTINSKCTRTNIKLKIIKFL